MPVCEQVAHCTESSLSCNHVLFGMVWQVTASCCSKTSCRSRRWSRHARLTRTNCTGACQARQWKTSRWVAACQLFLPCARLGFKTCLSKTKTKTQQFQDQDQDQDQDFDVQDQYWDWDSRVPRPRPRLRGSRPRPRSRLVKTGLETKTRVSRTPGLPCATIRQQSKTYCIYQCSVSWNAFQLSHRDYTLVYCTAVIASIILGLSVSRVAAYMGRVRRG